MRTFERIVSEHPEWYLSTTMWLQRVGLWLSILIGNYLGQINRIDRVPTKKSYRWSLARYPRGQGVICNSFIDPGCWHWRIDPLFKVEAFTCLVIRYIIKCKGQWTCTARHLDGACYRFAFQRVAPRRPFVDVVQFPLVWSRSRICLQKDSPVFLYPLVRAGIFFRRMNSFGWGS